MIRMYYRNEYTEKQWKALIDKAAELGCHVTIYGRRCGSRAEIDSTDRESQIIAQTGGGEQDRSVWAWGIHNMLLESTIGNIAERINLTRMPEDERNKLLKQFNIPE